MAPAITIREAIREATKEGVALEMATTLAGTAHSLPYQNCSEVYHHGTLHNP